MTFTIARPQRQNRNGLASSIMVLGLTPFMLGLTATAHAGDHSDDHGHDHEHHHKDHGVSGFIGLGAGIAPDYTGSEDYDPIPLVFGRIAYEGYALELRGLGFGLDVVPDGNIDAGPIFNVRGGRDDVENDVVDRLRNIDEAYELGGFARYSFSPELIERDRLQFKVEVLADVSGSHEGFTVGLGTAYSWNPTEKLGITLDVGTTYGSSDFADEYFSVDLNNSARSGLNQFDADGGFTDVSFGVMANYSFTEQWGMMARVGYSLLLSDAADSPIVDDEGSRSQLLGLLGVTYRF